VRDEAYALAKAVFGMRNVRARNDTPGPLPAAAPVVIDPSSSDTSGDDRVLDAMFKNLRTFRVTPVSD
jgi:hypothetical protein